MRPRGLLARGASLQAPPAGGAVYGPRKPYVVMRSSRTSVDPGIHEAWGARAPLDREGARIYGGRPLRLGARCTVRNRTEFEFGSHGTWLMSKGPGVSLNSNTTPRVLFGGSGPTLFAQEGWAGRVACELVLALAFRILALAGIWLPP